MSDNPSLRWVLPLIGACSAAFFWLLIEVLPEMIGEKRWLLLLMAIATGVSSTLLVSVGPLKLNRAAIYAGPLGVIAGALLFWSSWRFVDAGGLTDSVHPAFAFALLVSLSIPFVIAQESAANRWRDYEALFDNAWSIFVRSVTAWAFTGVFWLVVFLSDALLSLAGFEYIGEVIDNEFVWMVLTGIVLGLALAVLDEMKTVVSTMRRLALLLLRLLLPLVSVVVALFIFLVPFQGLSEVFGSFSAAATMLAMAAGAATLITAAVESKDEDAATLKLMVLCARGLSLLLPIIAGIAVYAIWVRVHQYGWTPARLAGTLSALVILGYALGYAISVLLGDGWRDRIRTVNIYVALSIIGLAGLWLSPVLNAERISANSHISRFMSGTISVEDLDFERLGEDWGKSGLAALERLRTMENPPQAEALQTALTNFDAGVSKWERRRRNAERDAEINLATVLDTMPVLPAPQTIPQAAVDALSNRQIANIADACRREISDQRPFCVAVAFPFMAHHQEPSYLIAYHIENSDRATLVSLVPSRSGGEWDARTGVFEINGDAVNSNALELITALQNGEFKIAPAKLNAIEINDTQFMPHP